MSTGETWTLGRRPALDGLRGIAVLLVLAGHLHLPAANAGGQVGVTMFFTLSGFLITSLLLDERSRGGMRLRRFYLRRLLRLGPALVACVAGVALVGAFIGGNYVSATTIVAALTYTTDFLVLTDPLNGGALGHTWSLAIEEQFYLLWPLVLLALRRHLVLVSIAACVLIMAARVTLWAAGASWWLLYYFPLFHADALLVGCALAALVHHRRTWAARPGWATLVLVPTVALSALSGPPEWLLLPTVVPWLTAAMIWLLVGAGSSWSNRHLVWVGRRSYGLYLWHLPVALVVQVNLSLPWVVDVPLIVAVSLLLTVLSWRFVETPFLRLKDKDRSEVPARSPQAVLLGRGAREVAAGARHAETVGALVEPQRG